MHSSKELVYPLYSDSSVELSAAFGLAFHMADETIELYLSQYNIDVEKASGQKHHNLPVPSVYIVKADGTVHFVHTDPDHTTRLSTEELLTHAV